MRFVAAASVLIVSFATIGLSAAPASAQWDDPNEVTAISEEYIVTQTPGGEGGGGGGGGGGGSEWAPGTYIAEDCYWREFEGEWFDGGAEDIVDTGAWNSYTYNDTAAYDEKTAELGDPTFYVQICQAVFVSGGVATPIGRIAYTSGDWVWPTEPIPGAPPAWTIAQLLLMARDRIAYPSFVLETNPGNEGVVNLPTYFGVPAAARGPRSASAQIGGSPTISATATPVSLAVRTGDGNVIRCPGLGSATLECQHTYERASTATGTYAVQSWIEYRITYSIAGIPAVGWFGPASIVNYPVAEIQAVNG